MQNWDDNNDYQAAFEDNSEQVPAEVHAEVPHVQPELVPAHADHGQSNEDFVRQTYIDLLGREPDSGGADYWAGVLNNGGSRDDIVSAFQGSDEYKALHAASVASSHQPDPQPQQLELWHSQDVQPETPYIAPQPVHVAELAPAPVAHEPSQPYVNQWGNQNVDINAYNVQIARVDNSSLNQVAGQYNTLLDQQAALSLNSFETYQQYDNLVKTKGLDSPDAHSLKSHMDQVNSASGAVAASIAALENDFMNTYQTKEAEAANLFQQYQSVVQTHGANSAEAQASYTTYQVARDSINVGPMQDILQTYHQQHLWDNGGPSDERHQGQSTGSGIMEDLMIGMGLASLSSSTFQEMSTEYQAPRAVGHYADALPGQDSVQDAQMRDQSYVNQIINQYSGQVSAQPQPAAPVVQNQQSNAEPGTIALPSGQVVNEQDYYSGGGGGNGGWGDFAGGMFDDHMDNSGGGSWYGAGSNYMNNSNDYTAGGNFNITSYQDANNEGQGPIDGPEVQAPVLHTPVPSSIHVDESEIDKLPIHLPGLDSRESLPGSSDSQPTVPYTPSFSHSSEGFPSANDNRFGSSEPHNDFSKAIEQALNPHLESVFKTDEIGGYTTPEGDYMLHGDRWVSKEAALAPIDKTIDPNIQVIHVTAYRGVGETDGGIKLVLDKEFAKGAEQVRIGDTIYTRPADGSTNWVPAALQEGVDAAADMATHLPGGTFAVNTVKAIPGVVDAVDKAISNVLGYAAGHTPLEAANDLINAMIPKNSGNIGPIGNPMGDFDPSYTADNSGVKPVAGSYTSDIKNAAGFIFDTGGKVLDAAVIHPIVRGGEALVNLSSNVLSPEEAAKEFGHVAMGALTAAPLVGGAVKAVGAGAELVNGVRGASEIAEVIAADSAIGRAGSTIGRIENGVDGIYAADGQLIKAGNYVDTPNSNVPRTEGGHVEIPGGSVPRIEGGQVEVPVGHIPQIEYSPGVVKAPEMYSQPGQPTPIVLHVDDVVPEHAPTTNAPVAAPHDVIAEPVKPYEMPQVGQPASNQALESVQRSIDTAPDLAQRFDGVLNNLRENGVEITGMTSREMRDLTGSSQTAAVFYMDEGVPHIAMLNNLSPGAKYEALLHELSHRTDYLNPMKNTGTGAIEFSSDAGGLLVPNYREFASVSEFKSHAVEFATQKQVVGAYIAEGNLVDAGAVTGRMRETIDARMGVQAELKDSVPKVEAALAENRAIEIVDGEAGSQRYVVTIADANGAPKEVSFPGPAGLNQEQAAAHIQAALNQVKIDIPINDAALAKSIDELNAFKEVIASGGNRAIPEAAALKAEPPPIMDAAPSADVPLVGSQSGSSAQIMAFPEMDMTPPKLMAEPQLFEAQQSLTNSNVIRQAIPEHIESTVSMQAFDGTGKASGDFVGVYNSPVQGEVHILVGDVMGHGDAAARGSVALQQVMAAPENQAVLAREGLVGLDRVLSENTTSAVNSAMSHLVLHPETGTLRATSVGDTQVLIAHADGAMTEVPRSGHSLGDGALEEVPAVRPTVVALRPHDQVYVVTDGIVDRFQSGGVFGLEGIRNAIAQARAQGMTVEQTVARLQAHPRPVGVDADDSTAFAFHWRPPGKIAR